MLLEIKTQQEIIENGQPRKKEELYIFEGEFFKMDRSEITIRRNSLSEILFSHAHKKEYYLNRIKLEDIFFEIEDTDGSKLLLEIKVNGVTVFENEGAEC